MFHKAHIAHEQMRWLRHDSARWVRPDAARFLAPGTKLEDAFPALKTKYSPSQPRVPAGNPDGGQWTDESSSGRPRVIIDTTNWGNDAESPNADDNPGFDAAGDYSDGNLAFNAPNARVDLGEERPVSDSRSANEDGSQRNDSSNDGRSYDTRLASNEEKPKLGQNSRIAIFAEIGRRLVRAFRSENGLLDLFNHDTGTVSHTQIDGRDIFGSNSTSPTYTSQDREAANRMRDVLIDKYPDKMKVDDIGQKRSLSR